MYLLVHRSYKKNPPLIMGKCNDAHALHKGQRWIHLMNSFAGHVFTAVRMTRTKWGGAGQRSREAMVI